MKKRSLVVILFLSLGMILAACSLPSQETSGDVVVPEEPAADSAAAPVEVDAAPEADTASGVDTSEDADDVSPPAESFNTDSLESKLSQFVLRDDDLPNDYRLLSGGESGYSNLDLINEMGELQAKQYIKATGRINGWQIMLERVHKQDFAPSTMENYIELFETNEGAQLALSEEWFRAYDYDSELHWVEGGCDLGDMCLFYYTEKHDPASQLTTQTYEVAFVYRNVLVWVRGRGLDIDMDAEYVLDAAQEILEKLESYAASQ